jgi:hypothetical protein
MLQVIGAGLARMATTSTKAALEELGFGPCFTYFTLFSRPDLADGWLAVYEQGKQDWSTLFDGFQATVDWPSCDFYEPLMQAYPDAKIVLNVRDPEVWYESMKNTIWAANQAEVEAGRGVLTNPMARLNKLMMWDGFFHGKFLDKQYAIEQMQRRYREVQERVPREKLLEFDVREGWEPLCHFLHVSVPDKPFPRLNDTQAFNERVQAMREGRLAGTGH